jgi:hypothetical protein
MRPPPRYAVNRLSLGILVPVLLCAALALLAAQQLPVIIYKLALVTAAGGAGYLVDRVAFPYARPHLFMDRVGNIGPLQCLEKMQPRLFVVATLRRAIIIAAAMLAVGLGL